MQNISEEKLYIEKKRLLELKSIEDKYSEYIIAGVDEAGRGPLAGPVVAGCVVLDKNVDILYINDSKKLSEKKRNQIYNEIINKSHAYGVGIIDDKVIDEINILEATHLAMKKAYEEADKMYYNKFNKNINMLFVDALKIKNVNIKQVSIIHGDALSISIAAASIVAKVTRDNIMIKYNEIYPTYDFAKHKGYGTKEHINKIKQLGPCEIHRKTFIKNFI